MSLIVKPSGCELVEEIDFDISDATLANITDIQQACEDVKNRQLYYSSYPHIVLRDHGVLWTLIIFFLRKEHSNILGFISEFLKVRITKRRKIVNNAISCGKFVISNFGISWNLHSCFGKRKL